MREINTYKLDRPIIYTGINAREVRFPQITATTAVLNSSAPFEPAPLLARIRPSINLFPGYFFREHLWSISEENNITQENRDNSRSELPRAIRNGGPVGSYLANNKFLSWVFQPISETQKISLWEPW